MALRRLRYSVLSVASFIKASPLPPGQTQKILRHSKIFCRKNVPYSVVRREQDQIDIRSIYFNLLCVFIIFTFYNICYYTLYIIIETFLLP